MQRSKDFTFIGFAIKARKVIYGANTIEGNRNRKYIMFICESASENTKKLIQSLALKNRTILVQTKGILLEDIVNKINCKTAAIIDKQLGEAVLTNLSANFEIIYGGVFNG